MSAAGSRTRLGGARLQATALLEEFDVEQQQLRGNLRPSVRRHPTIRMRDRTASPRTDRLSRAAAELGREPAFGQRPYRRPSQIVAASTHCRRAFLLSSLRPRSARLQSPCPFAHAGLRRGGRRRRPGADRARYGCRLERAPPFDERRASTRSRREPRLSSERWPSPDVFVLSSDPARRRRSSFKGIRPNILAIGLHSVQPFPAPQPPSPGQ